MTIHTTLNTKLLATEGITNLVGNAIYPGKAPPTVIASGSAIKKYIVYNQNDAGFSYHLNGQSKPDHPTIEFNCYAPTFAGAREIADAVIVMMEAWRGSNGVQHVHLIGDSDQPFELDTDLYMAMVVYGVWFEAE